MGTAETGSGTSARHSWSAGTATATTMPAAAGIAVAYDTANVGFATDDCVRFDAAAQQLSACTWLMARLEPLPWESDLCIGHFVPLMQHAIRASAVACHPAQTDRVPRHSVKTAAIAANRRANIIAYLECGIAEALSNPDESRASPDH